MIVAEKSRWLNFADFSAAIASPPERKTTIHRRSRIGTENCWAAGCGTESGEHDRSSHTQIADGSRQCHWQQRAGGCEYEARADCADDVTIESTDLHQLAAMSITAK